MLLNVLCVVIWHATNINWSTRVRTSFPSKYQEKWNEQQQQQLCRWTWKKVSALIAWKTPTHETIYTKIFENKAQTITCALPKLNTKAPYILNTTPNYFLFVASIVVGLLATLNYCFFPGSFFYRAFPPLFPTHSDCVLLATLQQISCFFRIRRFSRRIFAKALKQFPFSFICSVFNFRFAFICTIVSQQNVSPPYLFSLSLSLC